MRITKLSLTNFRSFRETQTIEIAPITLLFGPNSVGKSSVLMALFYLQQIIEKGQCNPQRLEALGNKLVGGFKNLVNGRDLSKSIVIRVDYDKQGAIGKTYGKSLALLEESSTMHEVSLLLQDQAVSTERVGLEFVVSWSKAKKTAYVQTLKVWLNDVFICETSCDEGFKNPLITHLNLSHVLLLSSDHDEWLDKVIEEGEDEIWSGWNDTIIDNYDGVDQIQFSDDGIISRLHAELRDNQIIGFKAIAGALPKPNTLLETTVSHDDTVIAAIIEEALSEILVSPLDNLLSILNDSVCIGPLRCIPDSSYLASQYPRQADWYDGRASWDLLSSPYLLRDAKINSWLADQDKLNLGYQLVYVRRDTQTRFITPSIDVEEFKDSIALSDALPGQLTISISDIDPSLIPLESETSSQIGVTETINVEIALSSKLYVGQEIDKESYISLWDMRNKIPVSSSDIGVGISQLLPLIVASQDDINGIVACEQPELHIHPRVQVAVGDLLIENSNDKTFLIETHSEHIVLRILRRIRENNQKTISSSFKDFNSDQVSITYLESTADGVITKRLKITGDGDFENDWPNGFFDERDEELF